MFFCCIYAEITLNTHRLYIDWNRHKSLFQSSF